MARKFAILVAGKPDENVIERKGTFEDMFLRLLKDGQDEEWRLFFVYQDEFPTADELAQLDGFVVTGSLADAFGQEDWLVKLREMVRTAASAGKRVLGVCFGHQVVGTAYGARVNRAGCFECGAREITVHPEARAAVGAQWAELLPDSLVINEVHQDQVLEVPQGATVLASSARCPIEMFAVGPNVLCIQGHPEFDSEVVMMLTNNHRHLISSEDLQLRDESYARLQAGEHSARLQQLCKAFLKG